MCDRLRSCRSDGPACCRLAVSHFHTPGGDFGSRLGGGLHARDRGLDHLCIHVNFVCLQFRYELSNKLNTPYSSSFFTTRKPSEGQAPTLLWQWSLVPPGFLNPRIRAFPHVHPRSPGSRPSFGEGPANSLIIIIKKRVKKKSYGAWKTGKVILYSLNLVRTALQSAIRANPEVEVRSARSVRARTGAAAGRGSENLGGGLDRPPLVRNGLLSPVPSRRRRRPCRCHRRLRRCRCHRRRRRACASSCSRALFPCP